jgi:hypothetical protein
VVRAPFAGKVTSVNYAPIAGITGANGSTREYKLVNKGASGSGTTEIATLIMISGVNATAFDEKPITLSATPANLVVAEGDILAWVSNHQSSGLADPGGLLTIAIERTY